MLQQILKEISDAVTRVPEPAREILYSAIDGRRRIFVFGMGRSGCVARSFAMRLRHLGKESYVPGETICPPAKADDLFIAISCSGTTSCVLALTERARADRTATLAITSDGDSPLARLAEQSVIIPRGPSIQPGNSLFEQAALLWLDAFVLFYREKTGVTGREMSQRHASLE